MGLDARVRQEALEGHLVATDAEERLHHVLAQLRGELAARDEDQDFCESRNTHADRSAATMAARLEPKRVEYLKGRRIWPMRSSVRLHVEVPIIEEEAMADVLRGRIRALLGEHHRVDQRHHQPAVDARDPQRQLVAHEAARRAEGLHGLELLWRADVQLGQDPIDDEAEPEISTTGLFEPGHEGGRPQDLLGELIGEQIHDSPGCIQGHHDVRLLAIAFHISKLEANVVLGGITNDDLAVATGGDAGQRLHTQPARGRGVR